MVLLAVVGLLFNFVKQSTESLVDSVSIVKVRGRNECTVHALGRKQNDASSIRKAFQSCGGNGKIIFPADQNYWIAEVLNLIVSDVEIEWRGQWTVRLSSLGRQPY